MQRSVATETRHQILPAFRNGLRIANWVTTSHLILIVVAISTSACTRERHHPPAASGSTAQDVSPSTLPGHRAHFVEAAEAMGLVFVHFNGATGQWRFPEIMGAGCALFDYDQDGDLDVYLVQGAWLSEGKALAPPGEPDEPRDRLFRNDLQIIDGRRYVQFVDVTDASGMDETGFGMGCAVGDVNNDGWADLYVTNLGPNRLYVNRGDGTMVDQTETSGTGDHGWGTSASFFDYDRDGWLDLVVANYLEYDPSQEPQCRSTHRNVRDYCVPRDYPPARPRLYRNLGDGRFQDVTETAGLGRLKSYGLGVIARDFDGDGWSDVYVANDSEPNFLWINSRDGTFVERGLEMGVAVSGEGKPQASMGLVAADFDGDLDDDLLVTHIRGEHNTYYRRDPPSGFTDISFEVGLVPPILSYTGFGAVPIDWDNDGWQDLFIVNGGVSIEDAQFGRRFPYEQAPQLFRNEHSRLAAVNFPAGHPLSQLMIGRGLALGDVDLDGDEDLLVSGNAGPVRLYLNESPLLGHWVRFRLIGTSSPRDGAGARITLRTAEGHTRVRTAARDGSYCSSSDIRVHFGLGAVASSVSVNIDWPSGRRQTLMNLAANCEHVVCEPEPGSN